MPLGENGSYPFKGLAAPETLSKGRPFQAETIRPLSESHGLAFVSIEYISPSVPALLPAGGPSAVIWGVWSVIIDSFYGEFGRRSPPHIRNEIFEGFSPSIANVDPSPPVVLVTRIFYIMASLYHHVTNIEFRGFAKPVGAATLRRDSPSDASAASCVPAFEQGDIDTFCRAARALAIHVRSPIIPKQISGRNREITKFVSGGWAVLVVH